MNSFNKYWEILESSAVPPRGVVSVGEIEFSELKEMVDSNDVDGVKKLISAMYSGTGWILRNAASTELRSVMLELAQECSEKTASSFYKMLDGCPNFHRVISSEITKNYSLYAIKHSFYFYNWNMESNLEKKFKELVYEHWRYVKFISGNEMTRYENNIPSDGQIDRLQIINYPQGGGQLREHEDPRKNQRVVSGLIMSKIGVDYESGGFYFRTLEEGKLNLESRLNVGDSVMFYGSIPHGVDAVDEHLPLNWSQDLGRWFIGMFVNDSDHVKDRVTATDISGATNFLS